MKTFFISMIMGLSQYLIGYFRGRKQAQQEIKGDK
jgi:hypothetical protein